MTGMPTRLRKAGSQLLTKCKGLRLSASDGSRRLTDRIADREMFMKGIDCSCCYEEGLCQKIETQKEIFRLRQGEERYNA